MNAGTQQPCHSWMEPSHCKAVSMLCSLGMTLAFPSSGNVCSFSNPNTDGSIHLKKPHPEGKTPQVDMQTIDAECSGVHLAVRKAGSAFFSPFFWPQIDGTLSAFTSFCCSFLAVITPGLQSREGQYLPMGRMSSSSTSVCVFSSVRPLDISYKLTAFMFGCTCEWPVMSVEQF